MGETDEVVASRSALLDFYGDRAVAHASYFVASIFGIVGLMTLLQGIGKNAWWDVLAILGWFIVYVSFAFVGYWTLRQFNEYASYAESLRRILKQGAKINEEKAYIGSKKDLKLLIEELERSCRKERAEELQKQFPQLERGFIQIKMAEYDMIFSKKQRVFLKKHIFNRIGIRPLCVVLILILAVFAWYQILA